MDIQKNKLEKKIAQLEKRIDVIELFVFGTKTDDLQKISEPLLHSAINVIAGFDNVSASLLQRRLSIGYARAARLLDLLEEKGYIGPAVGSKPRKVLKK